MKTPGAAGFTEKLLDCARRNQSWLCVGLDTDMEKLPRGVQRSPSGLVAFNHSIIDATSDLVCAYKPNLAFYEVLGGAGWEVLKSTLDGIPPHIPVILDAKRGDIGNTAAMYARALFEDLKGDAVTVSPYMGSDSLDPFLAFRDRGVFVLCLTSNPGAADLQLKNNLHLQVAEMSQRWAEKNRHVGLVVGATHASQLAEIRALCPDRVFLVPGVGAQGGALEETIRAGSGKDALRLVINASRSILYASSGADYADAARREAETMRTSIQEADIHGNSR